MCVGGVGGGVGGGLGGGGGFMLLDFFFFPTDDQFFTLKMVISIA